MPTSVEDIASSLVREYLSRKGLKQTLARMDEELPRTADSISNRAVLARAIHIDKLMKRNKERSSPLQTMVEVIVKYLLDKSHNNVASSSSVQGSQHSSIAGDTHHQTSLTGETAVTNEAALSHTGCKTTDRQSLDELREKRRMSGARGLSSGQTPPIRVEITPRRTSTVAATATSADSGRPRSLSVGEPRLNVTSVMTRSGREVEPTQRGIRPRSMAEWGSDRQWIHDIDEKPEEKVEDEVETGITGGRRHENACGLDEKKGGVGARGHKAMRNWHSTSSVTTTAKNENKTREDQRTGDLLYEDLEDFDLCVGGQLTDHGGSIAAIKQQLMMKKTAGQPIPLETAKTLRELLFGSAKGPSFNMEWRRQNFTFCELPGLEYGLVQHKGGPCGVLACVQAYIMKQLLFTGPSGMSCLHPSPEERNVALISALSDILWKLGARQGRAIVALPPSHTQHCAQVPSRSYTPDHLTEKAILHSFSDYSTLREFIESHVLTLQSEGDCGCIHVLLSALLSTGIENIREDMDDVGSPLIGTHSYCTQEMVNLLLTGYAVSNVFDGNVSLDSGSTSKHVLKGISKPSEIGFLSLFEHYGACVVGSHYKEPAYPIWVVLSESHFTVLFSPERTLLSDWQLEQKFDLFYFDGLANQEEEIRLTIDTTTHRASEYRSKETSGSRHCCDLIPPLQLCIQTKWKNASVDWNSSEPLL